MSVQSSSVNKTKDRSMSKTHERLLTMITVNGQAFLGEVLGVGTSEVSRKVNGESGFTLAQLSMIFDSLGVKFVGADDVVIPRGKYQGLVELAKTQLDNESGTLSGQERRHMRLVADAQAAREIC